MLYEIGYWQVKKAAEGEMMHPAAAYGGAGVIDAFTFRTGSISVHCLQ